MNTDTNALFLYEVDREDGDLMGPRLAILLPDGIEMPELAGRSAALFNILKEKLQSKEVVEYIIEKCCLDSDEFDKIKDVEYKDYRIVYTFTNEEEEEVEVYFTFRDIKVM